MANIFRIPVDNQHFRDTIEMGKPIEEISKFISQEDIIQVKRTAQSGLLRYWGAIPGDANKRNFERLQEGDEVLCYRSGKYIALAKVGFKLVNKNLAKYSWGETEIGKTWELIYFFNNVRFFQIDVRIINDAFGYSGGGAVMGFNIVSEDKLKVFKEKYFSLDSFIEKTHKDFIIHEKVAEHFSTLEIHSPYEAQFYLADLGNKLEFNTYVPATDSGREVFGSKLSELITVHREDLQDYVAPVVFDPLSNIDVIWFKDNFMPRFFFEVIHKTGWSEAILRLDLVNKHYENAKTRIVGPQENRVEFSNSLRKWSGPRENIDYREYAQLLNVHAETTHYNKLLKDFL